MVVRNYPDTDHFRMVTLPSVRDCRRGERIAEFLAIIVTAMHKVADIAQLIGQAVACFYFGSDFG